MIDFLKYRLIYLLFSVALLALGAFSVVRSGFVYSLDFVGGGLLEFSVPSKAKIDDIREFVLRDDSLSFQETGSGFIINGTRLDKERAEKLSKEMEKKFSLTSARFELVGASVSKDNIYKIVVATALSVIGILLYIAFNFKNWGLAVAAVVALLHDAFILVGSWSILGRLFGAEFDVLFMTTLLTTMSFSVHDTIVIFDKIQEEDSQSSFSSLKDKINHALNVTMMRSLNNSLTIILMLTALIILGGDSVRWFAIALLLGTFLGTYSSPFVAAPVYFLLRGKKQ